MRKEMGHNKGTKILNWAIDVQRDRQFEIDTEVCGIIWEQDELSFLNSLEFRQHYFTNAVRWSLGML